MTNLYFSASSYTPLARLTTARAEAVDAILAAIVTGFDQLPTPTEIKTGVVNFVASDTGTAGHYIISLPYTPIAYSDGMEIIFRVSNTNAGACDVNVNVLGAVGLRTFAGALCVGGECPAGAIITARYGTTDAFFRISNPLIAVASVTVNNLARVTAADTTPGYLSQKIFNYLTAKNPAGNEQAVVGVMQSATDTTPAHVGAKVVPIGAIKARVLAAAGNEILQLKLREETVVTATAQTVAIGAITPVDTSGGAIAVLNLPAAGAGDTALQDGDECVLIDAGGTVETNNVTAITGNAGNIVFMGQSAAATLQWNGPNFSMLIFRWKASASQWIGNGYD